MKKIAVALGFLWSSLSIAQPQPCGSPAAFTYIRDDFVSAKISRVDAMASGRKQTLCLAARLAVIGISHRVVDDGNQLGILKLLALVPLPKIHLTRYYGVFAPASPHRKNLPDRPQPKAESSGSFPRKHIPLKHTLGSSAKSQYPEK